MKQLSLFPTSPKRPKRKLRPGSFVTYITKKDFTRPLSSLVHDGFIVDGRVFKVILISIVSEVSK